MATGCPAFSAHWRHLLLLLLLLLVAHLQPPMVQARKTHGGNAKLGPQKELTESSGSSWDWISTLPLLSGPQFTHVAMPLLQMCRNAYNFQYHLNPHKRQQLIPIEGWSLSLLVPPAAPPRSGAAGVRALVYEECTSPFSPALPRVVVAFRGWRTSSTSLDELADLCAGKLLFPHYVDFLSPPSHLCASLFDKPSLDYLAQALAYTRRVLQFYPPSSVLLTGHSFGGGLAVLVSAAMQKHHECSDNKAGGLMSMSRGLLTSHQHTQDLSHGGVCLPVVSFSGPGTRHDFYDRSWALRHIITISYEWDFFSVRTMWKDHHGWLCVYQTQEPASCKACFSELQRLSSQAILKPRTSMDGVFNDKERNGDDDDDDNDDDNNNDVDQCPYPHEPCWDCLSETHAPETLLIFMERFVRPRCVVLGRQHHSAPSQELGCTRRYKHT